MVPCFMSAYKPQYNVRSVGTHARSLQSERKQAKEREKIDEGKKNFHPIQVIYNEKLIGKNLLGFYGMIDDGVSELEGVHL